MRRAAVLAVTLGVVVIGVATVRVAAAWRAAEAPLDVAPTSMDAILQSSQVEAARAAAIAGQVETMAGQVDRLRIALGAANGNASADTQHAATLERQLERTTAQLHHLQSQLRAGQARLAELNAAAARQAALNAEARGGTATVASHGDDHDEGESDDD
jgi:hypothetical protein